MISVAPAPQGGQEDNVEQVRLCISIRTLFHLMCGILQILLKKELRWG